MGCDYYTWKRIVIELQPDAIIKYNGIERYSNMTNYYSNDIIIMNEDTIKQWGDRSQFQNTEHLLYEAPKHYKITNDVELYFCVSVKQIIISYLYVEDEGWNYKYSKTYFNIKNNLKKNNITFEDVKRIVIKETYSHERN